MGNGSVLNVKKMALFQPITTSTYVADLTGLMHYSTLGNSAFGHLPHYNWFPIF